jgi:hypothetical protein
MGADLDKGLASMASLEPGGGGWEQGMHTGIGRLQALMWIASLGLALTMVEAGAPSVQSTQLEATAQGPAASGASADAVLQELEQLKRSMQRIQDRIQELERQQSQPTPPAPAPPTAATPEPAPAYGNLLPGVRVGGYGSFRFEASNLKEVGDTFTFRRFVLTVDAAIAEPLRSGIEVEFERFTSLELERETRPDSGGLRVEQAIEGSNASEISLEQAWLEYELAPWLRFKGGVVLVPVGRFNIRHDDNRWDLPRRPLVDRGIPVLPIKAAWPEVGMGFVGDGAVGPGTLSYQLYVVNGASLDTELETIAQTRTPDRNKVEVEVELSPSRGTANIDPKRDKAFAGRVAYHLLPDYELGLSGYYGRYTPKSLRAEPLWAVGVDGKAAFGAFEIEGEYLHSHFSNVSKVARSLAQVAFNQQAEVPDAASPDLELELELELAQLATTKHGYWLDFRYRFFPDWLRASPLGRFQNPQFIATLRWEQAWLNGLLRELEFENGAVTSLERENRFINRLTLGLAYRPVPLVVLQLAYEFTYTNRDRSLADVTNFLPARAREDTAHALLIGAAFGF